MRLFTDQVVIFISVSSYWKIHNLIFDFQIDENWMKLNERVEILKCASIKGIKFKIPWKCNQDEKMKSFIIESTAHWMIKIYLNTHITKWISMKLELNEIIFMCLMKIFTSGEIFFGYVEVLKILDYF